MGKRKHSKGQGFLHIRHSTISREIEIHTILKRWENLILIVRETDGKTQTFQIYAFLNFFA